MPKLQLSGNERDGLYLQALMLFLDKDDAFRQQWVSVAATKAGKGNEASYTRRKRRPSPSREFFNRIGQEQPFSLLPDRQGSTLKS